MKREKPDLGPGIAILGEDGVRVMGRARGGSREEVRQHVENVMTEITGIKPDYVNIRETKRRGRGWSLSHLPDDIPYPPPSKIFGGRRINKD